MSTSAHTNGAAGENVETDAEIRRGFAVSGQVARHELAEGQFVLPSPPPVERPRGGFNWPMLCLVVATLLAPTLAAVYPDVRDGLKRSAVWNHMAGFLASCSSFSREARATQLNYVAQFPALSELRISPVTTPPLIAVEVSGCGVAVLGTPHFVIIANGVNDVSDLTGAVITDSGWQPCVACFPRFDE